MEPATEFDASLTSGGINIVCVTQSLKNRLLTNSEQDEETGCWNWTKYTEKNGYGKTRLGGKTRWVHRLSYEVFIGPIPEGFDVCHRCDNRKCINPEHLFTGTRLDNMKDAASKNRIAKGEMLPHSKISDQDRNRIVDMAVSGIKYASIAKEFGICKQTAGKIALKEGVRRHGIG